MYAPAHSPSNTPIFSNNCNNLTLPPTPGRKRACYSTKDIGDVPFFFPTNKSLLISDHDGRKHDRGETFEQLSSLSSAPVIPCSLPARPLYGTKIQRSESFERKPFAPNDMTLPPFCFASKDSEELGIQHDSSPKEKKQITWSPDLMPLPPFCSEDLKDQKREDASSSEKAERANVDCAKVSCEELDLQKDGEGSSSLSFQQKLPPPLKPQQRNTHAAKCA